MGDGLTSYTWDARNQLTAMAGGFAGSLAYDGLGRRRSKTLSSVTTRFLYDGVTFAQEPCAAGTPTANFVAGPVVDEVFTRTDSSGPRALLRDGLGSTVALADSIGTVSTQYTYEPFGTSATTGQSSANPLTFTGREDDGSGLFYHRARYYQHASGRFTSEDPAGIVDGPNLYAYVGGDPVNFADPYGLTKITFDVKAGTITVDPEVKGQAPYTMPATSGRPNCNCTEADKDKGPIPKGEYTLNTSDLTNPGWFGDVMRNFRGDWGDWRAPLIPDPGTKTYGRSGFFIHGGRFPGSAGCIDVGGGKSGNDMTDRLLQDILADPDGRVRVSVK